MNSLSTKDTSQIPLHCNICPKRPDFSDVSHLLTHVASKGHLSNYYKMKVKGSSDVSAKRIVDNYDDWYAEWNLEELMRDRMSQKEKKRGGGGNVSRRASAANSNSSRGTPSVAPRGHRSDRLRDNMQLLDPQLGHRLRGESISRSATPGSAFSYEQRPYLPAHLGTFTHNGAYFDQNSLDGRYSPHIKEESPDSDDSDDDYVDDFDLSAMRSSTRRRAPPQHYGSESIASLNDDANSLEDMANDHTKLKGVLWPGMDMFDSATSEMKRKRNQKKHFSVLQSLQATSETVEPDECVHDKNFAYQKTRDINSLPEEDDLIEGESEPEQEAQEKKRTRRRPRPALQNKNVNSGRAERSRGQLGFGRDTRASRHRGDDDEADLTYGMRRPKKRSEVHVHRDPPMPELSYEQPRSMNYLTSGYGSLQNTLHGSLFHGQSAPTSHVPRTHPSQPSWGQMNGGFRPSPNGNSRSYSNQLFQSSTTPLPAVSTMSTSMGFSPNLLGQQLTMSHQHQPMVQTNNPLFQANTISNPQWDLLSMDPLDNSMPFFGGAFSNNNDAVENQNPLYNNFVAPKIEADDDGNSTISAKSDR